MQDFISAPKQIDKLFEVFPEHGHFRLFELIKQSSLSPSDKNLAEDNDAIEIMLVKTFKYAEPSDKSNLFFKLTDLGRQARNAGGHFAYLKKLDEKATADNKRQEIKDKSEELDLHLKQWQVRTKYLPYIVSFIALVFSILSYFKPEKKQSDLQRVQRDLQQLQDHVKLQDSLFQVDSLLKKRTE